MSKPQTLTGQTKLHSWYEAGFNILVGYGINFAANMLIMPLFGFNITIEQNLWIGVIFTLISLGRSYLLRRLMNRWYVRGQA